MRKLTYKVGGKTTTCYLDAGLRDLGKLSGKDQTVLITDEHVFAAHGKKLSGWNTIVIKAGEQYKVQATVDSIVGQLIDFGSDRKTRLVGIGGGVVTDLTGYVAAIYMRGLSFGFAPTSILAMVDAAIGGKNGIDVGFYKNLVGTIRQPDFLLYDYSLLKSLPESEWVNGFAEVIKHAAIKKSALFSELEQRSLPFYQKDRVALAKLIAANVRIKAAVVEKDEQEKGDRRLLNFGHTLGHAIENLYELSHGQAVAIGMVAACKISGEFTDFTGTGRLIAVLKKYGLPTHADFDPKAVMEVLRMDKKRVKDSMNYVLLNKIGQAVVREIPVAQLEPLLEGVPAATGAGASGGKKSAR